VVQVVIVTATGSVALLADTIHNFSDALTAVPLFIALRSVAVPPRRSDLDAYRDALRVLPVGSGQHANSGRPKP
jgi:hypothetical protein